MTQYILRNSTFSKNTDFWLLKKCHTTFDCDLQIMSLWSIGYKAFQNGNHQIHHQNQAELQFYPDRNSIKSLL